VELETTTRRNLPFFGTVISNLKRKGSLRSLAVNNVQHARVSLIHKSTYIYLEHHSVCPSSDSPNPSPASECTLPPPDERVGGGGHTRRRLRGWGSLNSDNWRKKLSTLPILWSHLFMICHFVRLFFCPIDHV
jgi:hypothetical protein